MQKAKATPRKSPIVLGRPPMPQGKAKNLTLTLRVSQEEINIWTDLATARGMTLRQYILHDHREAIQKAKRKKS